MAASSSSSSATATGGAASVLVLSCLLVCGTSASNEGQLQWLSEVVSGPARGRPLALHLDAALPADVQRAVVGAEAVQSTPHLILTLGFSYSRRQAALPGSGSFSTVLHVVLWLTPRPDLLQALWLHWKPRNLLLFSLGPSPGTDLLRHEALSGVEKVALIGHLPAQVDPRPDVLGVYTVLPFSSGGVRLLGPWRREAFASWDALFPDRFPSFEGYTFHIASRMADPPLFERNNVNPQRGDGVSVEMLKALSMKLNFTYTTTADSTDSKWGTLHNGSWDGVLGMLERREKNFTINALVLDANRGKSFDFSTTLFVDGFGSFLMSPSPLPQWMSIARVFRGNTWLATLSALVASCCFTLLQERVGWRWTQSGEVIRAPRGVAAVWLDTQRPLVGQSVPRPPRALPARTLVALWFFQCLIITVAYTSNLVGIFTSPAYPSRLHDLLDIVDSGYRVAVVNSGHVLVAAINESQELFFVRLREKLDLYPTQDDCIDTMTTSMHVTVQRSLPMHLALKRRLKGSAGYYETGKLLLVSPVVWFFPKHTPWKHKFDQVIQQLLSAGLVEHWIQDFTAKTIKDAPYNGGGGSETKQRGSGRDGSAPPLTLQHLQGVFYTLGLAWVAGGAVLLLELLTYRHRHSMRRSERPHPPQH